MRNDLVSRKAVMDSLTAEYNRRFKEHGLRLAYIEKAVNEVPPLHEWIPVDSGVLPELNEHGDSEYILLSFSNYPLPCIGHYEEDETGGAFYVGDCEDTLISYGLIVNAWMPLMECYKEADSAGKD